MKSTAISAILVTLALIGLAWITPMADEDPSWLEGLRSLPPYLDYSRCELSTYYCEGCGGNRPITEATTWIGPGRSLQSLHVRLAGDAVVMLIQLSSEDALSDFNYVAGFQYGRDGIWVHINKELNEARVEHTNSTGGSTISYLAEESFALGDAWVACQLPYAIFADRISPSAILKAEFKVALETIMPETGTEESFRFPQSCTTQPGDIDT